jgi:hypothetical protein
VQGGAVKISLVADETVWGPGLSGTSRVTLANSSDAEIPVTSVHFILQAHADLPLPKAGFISVPVDLETGQPQAMSPIRTGVLAPGAERVVEVRDPPRLSWTGYAWTDGVFKELLSQAQGGSYTLTAEVRVGADGQRGDPADWSCLASNEVKVEIQPTKAP